MTVQYIKLSLESGQRIFISPTIVSIPCDKFRMHFSWLCHISHWSTTIGEIYFRVYKNFTVTKTLVFLNLHDARIVTHHVVSHLSLHIDFQHDITLLFVVKTSTKDEERTDRIKWITVRGQYFISFLNPPLFLRQSTTTLPRRGIQWAFTATRTKKVGRKQKKSSKSCTRATDRTS